MRLLFQFIFLSLAITIFADVPNHSRQNTTLTYHYDFRGSTVALTDGSGHVTDRMEYSRYATTTFRSGTNDTPFLFNGRYGVQTDPNGLLYMRTRSYNPYLCRFINADPSGFSGGLNFYAYANGNPVSNVDPFGLASMGENSGASWTTRLLGAGQALGGLMMTVIGGETAETVVGLGAISYGQDQFYAGMRTMMTGQPTPTVLEETLEDAGMSPTAAGWTSAGIGMVLPFGAESGLVTEGTGTLRAGELTTYQDFVDRSVIGDNLEGHELWQHANLNENGLATTRLATTASQMNPVIVLDQETHAAVSAAQRALDARAMTPVQNINANAQILRDLNAASPDAINAAQRAALNHAAKYGY